MIKTRKELKEYLRADYERQGMKHPFLSRITYGENYIIRHYLSILRHCEYHSNQHSFIHRLLGAYYKLRLRKLSVKHNIYIKPNCVGKGLLLPHPGFVRIGSYVQIGEGCTILPMVLFGKKNPGNDYSIKVGDNCYFGTGVTVLGSITIGNNVTVAAGSVVINDVPDNAVVGGIPAKIIKMKEMN